MPQFDSNLVDPNLAARETLRLIGPDPQNWVPDREGIDHNVVIVGGGQSGSAFAFALRRAGIGKVTVIDAAKDGAASGPWLTSARMHKLRTPKNLQSVMARHGVAASVTISRPLQTLEAISESLELASSD